VSAKYVWACNRWAQRGVDSETAAEAVHEKLEGGTGEYLAVLLALSHAVGCELAQAFRGARRGIRFDHFLTPRTHAVERGLLVPPASAPNHGGHKLRY
jgi:hypothetical protein